MQRRGKPGAATKIFLQKQTIRRRFPLRQGFGGERSYGGQEETKIGKNFAKNAELSDIALQRFNLKLWSHTRGMR
jgi:hypothetical protein